MSEKAHNGIKTVAHNVFLYCNWKQWSKTIQRCGTLTTANKAGIGGYRCYMYSGLSSQAYKSMLGSVSFHILSESPLRRRSGWKTICVLVECGEWHGEGPLTCGEGEGQFAVASLITEEIGRRECWKRRRTGGPGGRMSTCRNAHCITAQSKITRGSWTALPRAAHVCCQNA